MIKLDYMALRPDGTTISQLSVEHGPAENSAYVGTQVEHSTNLKVSFPDLITILNHEQTLGAPLTEPGVLESSIEVDHNTTKKR